MSSICKDCFHRDPKKCEAIALCLPLEFIQDFEACRCKSCHYEESQLPDSEETPEPLFDPIESD